MAKKGVTKSKKITNREIQLALIDNFVNMQKVLTTLSFRLEEVSSNMNKMLQLFEMSAKSFISKNENGVGEERDLLKKLDTMLDQNKTIAKGLTLIEEKIRHKIYPDSGQEISPNFDMGNRPRPLPRI